MESCQHVLLQGMLLVAPVCVLQGLSATDRHRAKSQVVQAGKLSGCRYRLMCADMLSSCTFSPAVGPAGRLASMASQMGVSGAATPLEDLSKGVSSMASMLGGQVRQ